MITQKDNSTNRHNTDFASRSKMEEIEVLKKNAAKVLTMRVLRILADNTYRIRQEKYIKKKGHRCYENADGA